jgi:hypothetical protein
LLALFSFSFLFLLGGIATGHRGGFLTVMLSESRVPGESHERFRIRDMVNLTKNRQFAAFCLVSLFLFIMFGQMSSTFAVYSENQVHISTAEVGYLYAINGLLVVFLQFPIARLISHYRMCTVIACRLPPLRHRLRPGRTGPRLPVPGPVHVRGDHGRDDGLSIVHEPGGQHVAGERAGPLHGLLRAVLLLRVRRRTVRGRRADGPAHRLACVLLWASIGMFGIVAMIGYLLLGRRMSDSLNCTRAG